MACSLLFLCTWFISSSQKNVVYRFLMQRYLIKIPVHLPCLSSVSHAGPTLMTSWCWSLSSWPAGWPLSVQHNSMITPSHSPHAGRLTAFHRECFNRPLIFIHPHAVLLPPLYFPWMQFPNRPIPISKGPINCIYDMKLYYLSYQSLNMLISLNNLFPQPPSS